MAAETRWFIIHTYSGYENKVAENIGKIVENRKMHDKIFRVCIPMEKVKEFKEVSIKSLETMLKNETIDQNKFNELKEQIVSASPKIAFILALSKAEEECDNGIITEGAYETTKGELIALYPEVAKSLGIELGSNKRLEKKYVTEARNAKKELLVEVERQIFPSYVVVKLAVEYSTKEGEENVLKVPDETWHAIRYTRGVTGFVGPDGKPTPLTAEEIKKFGIEDDGAESTGGAYVELEYSIGDLVTITDGLMEGNSGVVEAIDTENNTVRVIISFMGKEAPVELALNQVKKAIE